MNEAPELKAQPEPRGRSRMIWWLVVLPAVLLLLALGAANWRVFHLAYGQWLLRSPNPERQIRGMYMIGFDHLRPGMTVQEVGARLRPLSIQPENNLNHPTVYVQITEVENAREHRVKGLHLFFDEDDRFLKCECWDERQVTIFEESR